MNGVDLIGKQFTILGKKNTGKTNFTKWLLLNFYPQHLAFDPNDEYKPQWGFNRYLPENKRSQAELDLCIDKIFLPRARQGQFNMLVVDECNRYHQKGGQLQGPIARIADWGTSHGGYGAGFIARRPSQVHTDIIELSDYIFIHRLTGRNDLKALEDISQGLSQEVQDLPQYGCVMVKPDGSYQTLSPPPLQVNDKPTSGAP